MCRAKKEENNGAAPLRSVSGEVFATFASLLLVALVLMCMLQTGLSCAYFAQERKSARLPCWTVLLPWRRPMLRKETL